MTPKAPIKPVVTTPAPAKLTYKAPATVTAPKPPAPEPMTMDQMRSLIESYEGSIADLKVQLDKAIMVAYKANK